MAVNLALALVRAGSDVGLLDADILGPSVPGMLGLPTDHQPEKTPEGKAVPAVRHGLKAVSMGLLSGDDNPSILRGPMVAKYLQMFVGGVDWGHLDYLILDLPPGTGDTQLTLAQSLPLSGAVIVTTPQHVSLKIARRGLRMFQHTPLKPFLSTRPGGRSPSLGSSKISRSARSDRSCGPGAQTKGRRRGPKMPSRRRVLGPRRSVSAVGTRGRFQCSGRTEGATTSMCGIPGWPATAPVASRRLADDHGSIQRPCGATWLHGRS